MKLKLNIPIVTPKVLNLIDVFCGMEFNAKEILESLQKKRFDQKMGTYLI